MLIKRVANLVSGIGISVEGIVYLIFPLSKANVSVFTPFLFGRAIQSSNGEESR